MESGWVAPQRGRGRSSTGQPSGWKQARSPGSDDQTNQGYISVVLEIHVKLTTGEKLSFNAENLDRLTTLEVFMTTLGRCYEIQLKFSGEPQPVVSVEFRTRVPVYIYVNMPGQTTNEDSKSKVEVKMKQRLYIDVNYLHLH